MTETVAAGQLRAFVERIERIEADIKEMNADKSEVYKELRGMGFDVKAVRQCVAARKLDSSELAERNSIFDLYWEALTGASRVHVHEEQPNPTRTTAGAVVAKTNVVTAGETAQVSHSSSSHPPAMTDNAGEVDAPHASPAPIDEDVPAFLRKERAA